MGRKHYQDSAQYFPQAADHPYADAMNAAHKVIFSHTIQTADWASTTIASGSVSFSAGNSLKIVHTTGKSCIRPERGVG
jgi:hypothetical protein